MFMVVLDGAAGVADGLSGQADLRVGEAAVGVGVAEAVEGEEVSRPAAAVLAAAAPEATGRFMKPKHFLKALDDKAIVNAIGVVEKRTSGEIRVFVTEAAVRNVVSQAAKQFVRLGMTKTKLRNGVLIFVAPETRTFAVVGDEGIHKRCGQPFWDEVTATITPFFKTGRFTEGILAGIEKVGDVLAKEFPWTA